MVTLYNTNPSSREIMNFWIFYLTYKNPTTIKKGNRFWSLVNHSTSGVKFGQDDSKPTAAIWAEIMNDKDEETWMCSRSLYLAEVRVQGPVLGLFQGLVKSFLSNSTGKWTILQLLCSQARKKLWKQISAKKNKQNLSNQANAGPCTEFPIPLFVRFCHVLFWEFPCPAWAVASCRSGQQAGGTP